MKSFSTSFELGPGDKHPSYREEPLRHHGRSSVALLQQYVGRLDIEDGDDQLLRLRTICKPSCDGISYWEDITGCEVVEAGCISLVGSDRMAEMWCKGLTPLSPVQRPSGTNEHLQLKKLSTLWN